MPTQIKTITHNGKKYPIYVSEREGKKFKVYVSKGSRRKWVHFGASGFTIGRKGSMKWKNYCSRSLGIAKKFRVLNDIFSPNFWSRKMWEC